MVEEIEEVAVEIEEGNKLESKINRGIANAVFADSLSWHRVRPSQRDEEEASLLLNEEELPENPDNNAAAGSLEISISVPEQEQAEQVPAAGWVDRLKRLMKEILKILLRVFTEVILEQFFGF